MSEENKELNPYLLGKREWSERYGSYIKQASNWKFIAYITSFIAIISVGGIIYFASQNKFIPYVVMVDKLGHTVAGRALKATAPASPNQIKYGLAEFITNFKTIYPDAEIQKDYVFKSYRYLSDVFPAFNTVSQHYQKHSPFDRAGEKVNITIESVLQNSKDTWQINWKEEVSDARGVVKKIDNYKGLVTILLNPPSTEEGILKNPIGLYIKDLSWSKLIK